MSKLRFREMDLPMLIEIWDAFVGILTNNRPGFLLPVLIGLAVAVNLTIHWLGRTEREGRW